MEVPDWVWEHCLTRDDAILNWSADRFAGVGVVDDDSRKVKIRGLQFDVGAIVALEGLAQDKVQAAGKTHTGATAPRVTGRRLSEAWPAWVAELVRTIHDDGVPAGEGSQGQEELINKVADALAARGVDGPSRTTVQPTVQAVLDRLRAAGN